MAATLTAALKVGGGRVIVRWVYADGCVAQTRLVKVMLANSVVIKEQSDWIEYYYKCAKQGSHSFTVSVRHTQLGSEQVLEMLYTLHQCTAMNLTLPCLIPKPYKPYPAGRSSPGSTTCRSVPAATPATRSFRW
jgi:hypothetical protein